MKKFILLCVLFPLVALAHSPKVYVQWTRVHARGFERVVNWEQLPKKPDPSHMQGHLDDYPGWVAAIKIDSRIICCCDHYAIVQSKDSLQSYCYKTDRSFYQLSAEVCEYIPSLKCRYYGNFGEPPMLDAEDFPWEDFSPPPDRLVRHGKYVVPTIWESHKRFWGDK